MAATVDDYLAQLPEPRRSALGALRDLIRAALPEARESLRYKMPTYDGAGGFLCAFASQKRHISLYLCDQALIEPLRDQLAGVDLGKGCIRFKALEDLPQAALDEILGTLASR